MEKKVHSKPGNILLYNIYLVFNLQKPGVKKSSCVCQCVVAADRPHKPLISGRNNRLNITKPFLVMENNANTEILSEHKQLNFRETMLCKLFANPCLGLR